tara:strand:+ start:8213 stop:9052 length:840 start_codon:yes stop_codon:yes gene_type:complete
MSENPLKHLYRSKTVYVELPSKGKFYKKPPKFSVDGEIGVMPMTTNDELKLKSPDALFNGEAMFDMLSSCVPDIENPREIPACDLDVLVFAIRIATSGDEMEISSECPHCEKTHEYEVNLTRFMASAKEMELDPTVQIDENTTVHVRPYSLESRMKTQIQQFHAYRMESMLNGGDISQDRKVELFNDALAAASSISVELVASNITKVELKSGEDVTAVEEYDHIYQWVMNMDSNTYKKIIGHIRKLSDANIEKEVVLNCAGCNKEYRSDIDLDPTNFFT